MNGEIICVGTELLLGNIVNTNARFLSEELAALGINVYNQSVVGDNELRIKQELGAALKRSQLVILTGGLGPTEDDMTKECVASYFSLNLVEDPKSRAQIEAYFKRTGRVMAQSNYKQAMMPKGAYIFKNDVGTAPGCAIEHEKNTVIILPGPPSEMEYMFNNYVKPYLERKSQNVIVSHKVRIFGESESKIEAQLKHLTHLHNPTVAPYANEGELFLRVTAKAGSKVAADSLCKPVINSIVETLGDCVYGVDCDSLQSVVVEMLKKENLKIATAESCTAGMLSSMITEVPGSSEVFEFGISAYANRVKVNALGVPAEIIERHGAVSEHTAAYMAMGVRKISGADIGIGITGVAGPGASESKPVGLVYIALADRHNIWIRKTTLGHGNSEREKVRRNSAKTALDLIRRYLIAKPDVLSGGFAIGSAPKVMTEQPSVNRPIVPAAKTVTPAASGSGFTDYELAQMINSVAQNDHYEPVTEEDAMEYAKQQSEYLAFVDDEPMSQEDARPSFVDRILILLGIKKVPQAEGETEYITKEDDNDAEDDTPVIESDENSADIVTAVEPEHDDEVDTPAPVKAEENSSKVDEAPAAKKAGFFERVMKYIKSFIPWKGDKIGEIIRKLVFIISLIALILSSVYIVDYFHESDVQNDIVDEVRKEYNADNVEKDEDGVFFSFEEVIKRNSDTRAWITIPGTLVDNPVVLGADNNFYLKHNFLKEKSRYGTLYFDAQSEITAEAVSQNLVIYGHEMKDGSMFGTLKRYKDLNFYRQYPVFSMRTLYDDAQYKIFSVFITNASPEQDNGYVFEYRTPNFTSQDAFLALVSQYRDRSIINTGVDVVEGDRLVTLSTCTGEFTNARLVIVARRIREGEEPSIDLTQVSVNENPLYPQAYYDKKGIKNPFKGVSTDSSSEESTSSEDLSSDSTSGDTSSDTSSQDAVSSEDTVSDDALSSDTVSDNTQSTDSNIQNA
ncbi:MAG: competence/damage-inducible protein A [Clostridia bacterium]|nr:competence/damage-inducible protein A [Clostridia bacterium]